MWSLLHYSMYMIICKMEQIILIPVVRFRTLLIYITAQEKTENTLQNELLMEVTKGIKRERSFCYNEISGSVPEIGGMLVERLQ